MIVRPVFFINSYGKNQQIELLACLISLWCANAIVKPTDLNKQLKKKLRGAIFSVCHGYITSTINCAHKYKMVQNKVNMKTRKKSNKGLKVKQLKRLEYK